MDQFTRRIVGFAVHRGVVDGVALCRMSNRAIHTPTLPKYLSSDHDPLYRFHQWQANLRVLGEFLEIMRQWESDRVRDSAAAPV
jgi:putative transposase